MADRWPLTGRDEELRVISEALADDAHQGIVLTGLAGVGKTRLAREASDAAARDGWAVRRIAGTGTGRPVTLGAFARWADDTSTSPLTVARKVFAGLTADTDGAPLLVLVDDAHLLDDFSALIVHQLVLQGVARVIATSRTGEPAPDAVTALWKDGLLRRLELQPLSHDESRTLLQTVLDGRVSDACVQRMWDLSRGNVLFLHHLAEEERAAGRLAYVEGVWNWTGIPLASPSLVELVEMQIGSVSDELRDIVDIVAIAEPLARDLLTSLTDPSAVEAAEQRGLIMSTLATDAVYVGHPLYGEIRLGKCGPLRLKRLRGQVATAMADAATADPLRLGLLWLESDLPPNAQLLTTAANIAAYRLDLEAGERLARAAADAHSDPLTKLLLAYILFLQEKGKAAEEILDTLDAQEFAAPGFIDGVVVRAANLLWALRDSKSARHVLEDALALDDEARSHPLRTFLAVVQATAAEPEDAIESMAAVDYAQLDNYGHIMGYSAETIALGDLGRVKDAGDRASAAYQVLAESPTDSFQGSGIAEFHAFALVAAGCVDEAFDVAERYYREWAEMPSISRSMAVGAMGITALAKGDLVLALHHLDAAQAGFGGYGELSGLSYRFRIAYAEALARSGSVDAAVAALDVAAGSRHPAYLYVESALVTASAWVSAAQGRVAEARETISRASEFARTRGQLSREVVSLQTAVQLGDASGAARLSELAGLVEGPRAPLAARYARTFSERDGAGLDTVSHEFEEMGDVLAAADAAAQAATCLRRAGYNGSALTASARAHRLAKECGGAASPALNAARVPLPFTRREHEIARLVGDGLSNKEIAEATSLSVRTVEGHIYQASTKAGVTSRSELSTLLRQFSELGTPAEST